MNDKNLLLVQVYVEYLPEIRKRAKELGWAIGVHGSLVRDFDLIAVKWVEDASSHAKLFHTICDVIDEIGSSKEKIARTESINRVLERPHGRISYDIQLGFGAYIDLSIMTS